jgi:PAS domain S-box-containing protein
VTVSFRARIFLGLISLLLLLAGMMLLIVSDITTEALLGENRRRGIAIATGLAARAAEPMLARDYLRLNILVEETVRHSDDIAYAFIQDRDGAPMAHSFSGGFPVELGPVNPLSPHQTSAVRLLDAGAELIYDYALPVQIAGNRFGAVRLGLRRTRISETARRLMWSASLATGVVVFIAGLVAAGFAGTVTRRIRRLHDSSQAILQGNLEVRTAAPLPETCWEIRKCARVDCPVYGDPHGRCWYTRDIHCTGCGETEPAERMPLCRRCRVYRARGGDEIERLAESFDAMADSLQGHISDLESVQQHLQEQKELLRTVLNATPDFVGLQDTSGRYRAVNAAFCRLAGSSEADLLGRTDPEIFPEERAAVWVRESRQVRERGEAVESEAQLTVQGRRRWFHLVRLPVRDGDGEITGVLCSGRDITDMREMQDRLIQSQKMEALGQLAAGVAHEINTPLGIILGYAQLLARESAEDDPTREDLSVIERQCKSCQKIVSDLLNFSRRTESVRGPLDLNACVAEVVAVMDHTFEMHQVRLDRRLSPDLPVMAGDRSQLRQVVMNLLNNARDAAGNGGRVRVETRHDADAQGLELIVRDTGPGIPVDRMARIFDPFFTTKPADQGTGLGLSVTFGIVEAHGGRITVESPAADDGTDFQTAFRVRLPATGGEAAGEPSAAGERALRTG